MDFVLQLDYSLVFASNGVEVDVHLRLDFARHFQLESSSVQKLTQPLEIVGAETNFEFFFVVEEKN